MIEALAITIGLHLTTYHFDRNAGYEEFNPGIYAKHDGWIGGIYANSESTKRMTIDTDDGMRCNHCEAKPIVTTKQVGRRWSAWAGHEWQVSERVHLVAGLATGYHRVPLAPMGAVTYTHGSGARAWLGLRGVHVSWEF